MDKLDEMEVALFESFPDDVRHPLIVENPDWEEVLLPVLSELGGMVDDQVLDTESVELWSFIKLMMEVSYTMGYYKRKTEVTDGS